MCYQIILSTTAASDLDGYNQELLGFSRVLPLANGLDALEYPHRWHVQSKARCSCTFRHARERGLGFGEPVDWYPEAEDAVAATIRFTAIVRELVAAGHKVDCIDLWQGENRPKIKLDRIRTDLSAIGDREFRFFEDSHHQFFAS